MAINFQSTKNLRDDRSAEYLESDDYRAHVKHFEEVVRPEREALKAFYNAEYGPESTTLWWNNMRIEMKAMKAKEDEMKRAKLEEQNRLTAEYGKAVFIRPLRSAKDAFGRARKAIAPKRVVL